ADAAPAPVAADAAKAVPPPRPTKPASPAKAGVTCGKVTCNAGDVCCNPSCGTCTPPGGACTQMMCDDAAGSVPPPPPAPTKPATKAARCKTDADCRVHSSYCEGCTCLALGVGQSAPACKGTVVNCFVDPCRGKATVCRSGSCDLVN
ncbi:MAG: hypothetical protein M3680_29345, partial [Myxococcota bacterium]|nr:hypothetical protein [Myxococcota bacterium]